MPVNVDKNLTLKNNTMDASYGELFKKLNDTIWELRTKYESNEYRLLSFWDTRKNTLIIATHGFQKKTQKTPLKEIAKAEKIREEYFNTHK